MGGVSDGVIRQMAAVARRHVVALKKMPRKRPKIIDWNDVADAAKK